MGREPDGRRSETDGRADDPAVAALRRALPGAGPGELERALDDPALGVPELLLWLRNTRAPAASLVRVAGDARWVRHARVRRMLAEHPNLPPATAGALLQHLFWRDLLEVATSPRAHPFARRRAEELLRSRLDELSSGERLSLARRAPRSVLLPLLVTDDARVLLGVLDNPRLVEADALRIAGAAASPAEVLARLARHPRWSPRLGIRLALLHNPRTPVAAALRIVAELDRRELTRVAADATIPRVVRIAAERRGSAARLL